MKNFLILATKRSGHSAIQFWLDCQKLEEKHFLGLEKYPSINEGFRGYSYQLSPTTISLCQNKADVTPDPKIKGLLNSGRNIILDIQCEDLNHIGIHTHVSPRFGLKLETFQPIIVVRSWWNQLASIANFGTAQKKFYNTYLEVTRDRWISHAKEALGLTNYLNGYTILYDWWVYSKIYRRKVCMDLGLKFTDYGYKFVPHNGSGSSFDALSLREDANKMKVLERYRNFSDNNRYLDEVLHPECIELSLELFKSCPEFLDLFNSEKYRWYRDKFPWFTRLFRILWK